MSTDSGKNLIWISLMLLVGLTGLWAQLPRTISPEEVPSLTDDKGFKQGLWRIEGKKNSYEEGVFVDGKKSGIWKGYFASGKLRHEITYLNGLARGAAVFYFEDGNVNEQGYWDVNHWEGDYKYYYENGQMAYHFQFNENGKREGAQRYYHENGVLKYQGNWLNGKTEGAIRIYNSKGQLESVRNYVNGKFASSEEQVLPADESMEAFDGTGTFTLYDKQGLMRQKGYFEDGNFIRGEWYRYDEQGKLKYTDIYFDGVKTEQIAAN